MNKTILEGGSISEKWKMSSTVMIPKKSKPKVNELRPTALTNIAYKLVMSLMRMNIEENLIMRNKRMNKWGSWRAEG